MSEKKTLFVVDPLSDAALGVLGSEPSIEVDNRPGLPQEEKLAAARRAHGIIVRSQTKMTAEFFDACERLEVVVRAGVGVDNIDIEAATKKGVVVQNIPGGNTRSAAEHAVAMLLSLARNIPQAVASMRQGKWDRKTHVGTELEGKTIGIVGLGKIGRHVLNMASGLGMKVLGFDPFVSPQIAEELAMPLAPTLEELIGQVDVLTLHVPLSSETRNLVDAKVLGHARKGLLLVNCARGGIVDERALLAAIEEGQIGGAALDVFEQEPPDFPALIGHPRVIATPHLGASTREAQVNVAVAAAQQMVAYFKHGRLTSPVNALSLEPDLLAEIRPYHELALRLGLLQAQLLDGNPRRLRVKIHGDLFDSALRRHLSSVVLCGFLKDRCSETVNPINAHHLATDMGLAVEEIDEGRSRYFHQMLRVEVEERGGLRVLAGTIRGQKGLRLVALDGYHFDAVLEGRLLLIQNDDRPGMIGVIGQMLSDHQVNISYMSLGRDKSGGTAMAVMNLDEPVPEGIAEELERTAGIRWARLVQVPE